jgi:NADH-quinone oxidoreductase subunit K
MDIAIWLLVLSAFMFGIGLYGLISRRNILRMLLSAEITFNSALLALLTFSAASSSPATGGITALLAIGIEAADVGMIVSIAVLMFHLRHDLDVYELKKSEEEEEND